MRRNVGSTWDCDSVHMDGWTRRLVAIWPIWFQITFLLGLSITVTQVASQKQTQPSQNDNQHHLNQQQEKIDAFCRVDNFHLCQNSLQNVAQRSDLVTTKAELIIYCMKLKESVKCMDRHIRLCFGPTERKVYNHVIAGARQLTHELCVPGKVQEEYLRHAACVTNATNPCESVYKEVVSFSQNVNEIQDVAEGLKRTCCGFSEFMRCKSQQVTAECGPEATLFHQRHLETISDPLIHEHCATFIHLPENCLPKDSCNQYTSDMFILVAILFCGNLLIEAIQIQ